MSVSGGFSILAKANDGGWGWGWAENLSIRHDQKSEKVHMCVKGDRLCYQQGSLTYFEATRRSQKEIENAKREIRSSMYVWLLTHYAQLYDVAQSVFCITMYQPVFLYFWCTMLTPYFVNIFFTCKFWMVLFAIVYFYRWFSVFTILLFFAFSCMREPCPITVLRYIVLRSVWYVERVQIPARGILPKFALLDHQMGCWLLWPSQHTAHSFQPLLNNFLQLLSRTQVSKVQRDCLVTTSALAQWILSRRLANYH